MRSMDSAMRSAMSAGVLMPALLVQLSFATGTTYAWSGVGPIVYAGNTYQGVGTLGKIGAVAEGTGVRADGTSLTLSGIDPTLYADCMDDIQLGAPVKIYYALLNNGAIIGAPYLLFSGLVDKPTITEGVDTIAITLQAENRITNLNRASGIRYDNATQRLIHANDSSMMYVEQLNDAALAWGTS